MHFSFVGQPERRRGSSSMAVPWWSGSVLDHGQRRRYLLSASQLQFKYVSRSRRRQPVGWRENSSVAVLWSSGPALELPGTGSAPHIERFYDSGERSV